MVSPAARSGLVLVAVAGAWWFTSCLVDGCSALTNLATGGIMAGFLVAAIGAQVLSNKLMASGFATAAVTPLGFTILEVQTALVVASGAWLLMLGAAASALGVFRHEIDARSATTTLRIGLATAGLGTGIWGVEKLFSPEWAMIPYLLAPIGLLLAAYSWRASALVTDDAATATTT